MPTFLRTLRLLAIVIWVGGIIFFAFVLAPVSFRVLPSTHEAGSVVGASLRIFDVIGLVCGVIFCVATATLRRAIFPRGYDGQILLTLAMLLATAYIHFSIIPAMEQDRLQAGGTIETAPLTNPARIHFEQLHKRSERVESAVLLCGLVVVFFIARESPPPRP